MKRYITAALLASAILLAGCGGEESTDAFSHLVPTESMMQTADGRVLTVGIFNPVTGATLPACADPICDHTEAAGCPFAGYNQVFAIRDGKMYFSVNIAEKKPDGQYLGKAYRVYDLESGAVKELYAKLEPMEQGTKSSANSLAGDWQYVSESGTTDYYYRVNYRTGEYEDLSDRDEVILPIHEDGDYLYAPLCVSPHDGAHTGLVRTDPDFANGEILFDAGEALGHIDFSAIGSGWIYYWTLRESSYDVHRYSLKTGKSETVLEDVLFAVIGGDRIYYTKAAENPKKLYFDLWRDRDVYDNVDGKIYSCKLDGKSARTVYDDNSHILRSMDMKFRGGWLICDLGILTEREWEDGTMQPRLDPVGGGRLVIDTRTGEAKIYE